MASTVVVCGGVLMASLIAASQIDARGDSTTFVMLMGLASIAYVGALIAVSRGLDSRRLLMVCLLLAVAWRGAIVPTAPLVSDDVYRYVWDGRVQRLGHNPYRSAPDDPSLEHLHTEVTRRIDPTSAALPTIYPPAAELFFRGVTSVHESVAAMVIAVVVCDLLTMLVLWRWLATTGRNPWRVIAYAWHPLVALEGAGGGHIDAVGTLFVVVAGFALSRRRGLLAASALAAAFAVKFIPVVLVPLLWRRVSLRDAAVGVGLIGLAYLPFLDLSLRLPVGSLGAYTESWRFNGPVFALLEPWLGVVPVLALATGVGIAVAWRARSTLSVDDPAAWAWPLAASLLLMPAVYPWYLLWLTPFLTTRAGWPLVAWTLGSMLTYVVWGSELSGNGWVLPGWVVPLEYGLVAGVWLSVAWRARGPFARLHAS